MKCRKRWFIQMLSEYKMRVFYGSRSLSRKGRHSRRLSSSSTEKMLNSRKSCTSCRKITPILTRTSANKRQSSCRKSRFTRLKSRTWTLVQEKHTTIAMRKLSQLCNWRPQFKTSSTRSLKFNRLMTKIKLCRRENVYSLRTKNKRTKRTF